MDTRKFAMDYGAYLGLVLIVVSFIVYILGLEEQKSIIPSLLNNFLMIGAIVYSVIIFRDNFNGGYISYGQSLKIGTSVVFFASVILAFYTFLFITFINTEYLENITKVAEQEILFSNPEISDEDLDMALSMTQKMLQPQWMITWSVLGGTFMGFFYSLIISFFVKKESDEFILSGYESSQTDEVNVSIDEKKGAKNISTKYLYYLIFASFGFLIIFNLFGSSPSLCDCKENYWDYNDKKYGNTMVFEDTGKLGGTNVTTRKKMYNKFNAMVAYKDLSASDKKIRDRCLKKYLSETDVKFADCD